jgi:transposase-like protein
MGVLNELRGRGEEDILKACMDGLTGFPEGVVPPTCVQVGIVPMLGNSPKYVSYQDLKKVCTDLQGNYPAAAAEAANREALEALGKTWEPVADAV